MARRCLHSQVAARSTAMNVPVSGSATKITWNQEDWDTDNIHASSSEDFVIPAGWSKILVTAGFEMTNPNEDVQIIIFKNSVSMAQHKQNSPAGGTVHMTVSCELPVVNGDIIEIGALHGGAATQTVGPDNTFVSIRRLD